MLISGGYSFMVLYMFPFIGRFECTVIFCLFEDVPGFCERFRLVIPCACKTFSDFSLFIVKYHFSRLQEQTEFVFNVNIKLYYVSASLVLLHPCTRGSRYGDIGKELVFLAPPVRVRFGGGGSGTF